MDVLASLNTPKHYIDRMHTCSKVKVHITAHCATKFKTTKFDSGALIELFTKISTHENNPLYGMQISHMVSPVEFESAIHTS